MILGTRLDRDVTELPPGEAIRPKEESCPILVEMRGISKSFGAVRAVENVDLLLHRQEILGLVGDNAAGKSTLMKVLAAVHTPDKGTILMEGREVRIGSPAKARRLGIEMIFQDFSLAPNLNIPDNVFLGREAVKRVLGIGFLDRARMEEVSRAALAQTGIVIDNMRALVTELSGGQMQAVAIARATALAARVIIMDEPTASLSVKAIPPLLDLMGRLRQAGASIVFITHRIQDIFSTCDRIMVLRRGRCVGVAPSSETSVEEVTALITGAREAYGSGSIASSA